MKKLIGGGLAALALGLFAAPVAGADLIPDNWYMDDGIGVGVRIAGTHCLSSELHQFADSADGSGYALWCAPPAFIWVSVK